MTTRREDMEERESSADRPDAPDGERVSSKNASNRAAVEAGVTADSLPGRGPDAAGGGAHRTIRGRALVFWDPKTPGKKRDAIDTDQITPAAACVSESLDTLDDVEVGLVPLPHADFATGPPRRDVSRRRRRFAIGSSREMSPAGLKGVAEEAGLELVVVCGANMGDIFRRTRSISAPRRAEPRGRRRRAGRRRLRVRPRHAPADERDAREELRAGAAHAEEEEIRRSGGIFAVGRREFRRSAEAAPSVVCRTPKRRAA